MGNQFLIDRQAFGTFSYPSSAYLLANTSLNLSITVPKVHIPTGAIIKDIKYVPVGAVTMAGMSAATINAAVGTQQIGAAAIAATNAFIAGSVYNHTVTSGGIGAAGLISTGGPLVMHFASSDANRSLVRGDIGVYVGYLCSA